MNPREESIHLVRQYLEGLGYPVQSASLQDALELDSLTLIELVELLERGFEVVIAPTELVPEHFHSIEAVARFIERKKRGEEGPCGS